MQALGLPIDLVTLGDITGWRTTAPGILAILTQPPHPAAAKLLLHWMLSDEGWEARLQTIRDSQDVVGATYSEFVPLHNTWAKPPQLGPEFDLPDDPNDLYVPQVEAGFMEGVEEGRQWLRDVITERRFKDAVDDDWRQSMKMGISGVPTFVANRTALVGWQPYDALEGLAQQAGAVPRKTD